MSELKARHVVDVYDGYAENPCKECSQVYLKSEADKVIAEKDAENRRLKRTLWLARARTAYLEFRLFVNDSVYTDDNIEANNAERMAIKWQKVERKCRAKAEEFGG